MRLGVERVSNFLVIKPLERRINFKVANQFKERMAQFISDGNMFILLNLSLVEFIDSSGLGAIVASLKLMGGRGDLFICGVDHRIMTLFKLTRMDRVFRIFSTEQEAIDALTTKHD